MVEPESITLFFGSYTTFITPEFGGSGDGVVSAKLNFQTGELSVLHTQKMINPSYLVLSDDQRFLFTASEVLAEHLPILVSYKIADDDSLSQQNQLPIDGGCPCHVNLIDQQLFVACYETGNVLQFPLDRNQVPLASSTNHYHQGASVDPDRQTSPHAHQVSGNPINKDIYVCDLGIDTIKAYLISQNHLTANPSKDIAQPVGGGVRHMVFSSDGTRAYAINELSGQVSSLIDHGQGFEQVGSVGSLPPEFKGKPSASAIRLHPTQPLLYVANRVLNAITVFDISGDKPALVDYHYTHGEELRDFNISDDGKWLVACHQISHDTVVYKLRPGGELVEHYRTDEIRSPACVVFKRSLLDAG